MLAQSVLHIAKAQFHELYISTWPNAFRYKARVNWCQTKRRLSPLSSLKSVRADKRPTHAPEHIWCRCCPLQYTPPPGMTQYSTAHIISLLNYLTAQPASRFQLIHVQGRD